MRNFFLKDLKIYCASYFLLYYHDYMITLRADTISKCSLTFSNCLVDVIQIISVMMLLLRDRLIITFKETDITLNRVSRTALRRAYNYITTDLRYIYTRLSQLIIIFISICSESPIISTGFTSSLAKWKKKRERNRVWIKLNLPFKSQAKFYNHHLHV